MKKRLIIIGFLIPILFVLAFRIYVITHSTDIDPIDDTDLLLVRPDVAATNNAYQVFTNAMSLIYLPEEYDLDDYLWDVSEDVELSQEKIISLIESNSMVFAAIKDGTKREYCFKETASQSPILVRDFMQLHIMLLIKVKVLMDTAKLNEALDAARLSLRLGYLYEKDAEYVVDALAGITMIERSLFYIEEITDQRHLSSDIIPKLVKQLSELEDLRTGLENGYKSEYSFVANEVINQLTAVTTHKSSAMGVIQAITGKNYVFKPNATKKMLAEHWRHQINNLNNPGSVQLQQDTHDYKLPTGSIRKILFFLKENSVGKIFISLASLSDFSETHKHFYATEKSASDLKTKLLLKQQTPFRIHRFSIFNKIKTIALRF